MHAKETQKHKQTNKQTNKKKNETFCVWLCLGKLMKIGTYDCQCTMNQHEMLSSLSPCLMMSMKMMI